MDAKLKKRLVAPDGGWGWAIAIACTIHFFLVSPLLTSFGLIYKTEFKRLGFSGTQSSSIMSVNGGLSMLCGLINGSLLNKFGTRKVSICSAVLIVSGLLMTAYSTTFIEFMIYYGVITSIGMGMGTSSYTIAVYTYFEKKRNKVTSYVLALFGVGSILFPQLVSFLMSNYTVKDTMLIISALCGNTLVAAVLLQPVKWHMKVEIIPIEDGEAKEEDTLFDEEPKDTNESNVMHIYDDVAIRASMCSLNVTNITNSQNNDDISEEISKKKSIAKRIINGIINTFDLSLLKDLVFLNILIGLSIDFFAEFSYMVLLPFILMETNLSVEQTATFLSIYAVADICFRLFTPFIASFLKQRSRVMYVISLILLLISRTFLLFITDYLILLFIAAAIGAFRGMRLVHWSLVIPEYIATERLAASYGLFFTLNGLGVFAGGPIIGALRDIEGDYKICMILLNATTLITIIMWTLEWIHKRIKLQRNR